LLFELIQLYFELIAKKLLDPFLFFAVWHIHVGDKRQSAAIILFAVFVLEV